MNLEALIGIVEHSDVLAGDMLHLARLNPLDHLVVLGSQPPRDGSRLLPAEDILNPRERCFDELAMGVVLRRPGVGSAIDSA